MAVCRRGGRRSGQVAVAGTRVGLRFHICTDLIHDVPIEIDVRPLAMLRHYIGVLL